MTHERSTEQTHKEAPGQKHYDEAYYAVILPWIHGNVLDLGCGRGLFTVQLAEIADRVTAIDKFPIAERLQHETIEHIDADITKYDIAGEYDCVVATEFIEHIYKEDFLSLLPSITKCLKPGGIFVGSTPHKIQPTTNQYHLYEYTAEELKETLEESFEVEMTVNGHSCAIWKATKK